MKCPPSNNHNDFVAIHVHGHKSKSYNIMCPGA